ncbi:hypothetical protein [Microcystis phage Mel-JY34]
MTRDEARALVAAKVGFRTDLNATIDLELQLVQRETLETDHEFKPWFLFADYTDPTFVTTPGVDYVSLPSDFLLQIEDTFLYFQEPNATGNEFPWSPIRANLLSEVMAQITTDGVPSFCSVQGSRLYIRPTPQEAYALRLFYFKSEPVPTGGGTNLWLTHSPTWLINATASKIADEYLQDEASAQKLGIAAAAARKRIWLETETRMNTGLDLLKGGDN